MVEKGWEKGVRGNDVDSLMRSRLNRERWGTRHKGGRRPSGEGERKKKEMETGGRGEKKGFLGYNGISYRLPAAASGGTVYGGAR